MTQRLYIIGAGREQVPAIERAKAFGLHVVTSDLDPNAPGAALADQFFAVSTADRDGAIAVARQCGVDGVMTLSSETGVPTVAAVAAALGLPGFSRRTARLATDKLSMKTAFVANAVPTTPFGEVRRLEEAHRFADLHGLPIVLKPSCNSGQRGTSLVRHRDDLAAAVQSALSNAADGRAIIETFSDGPELNVIAVVTGGVPTVLSISERVTAKPPHFGIAVAHSAPFALDGQSRAALFEAVARAVSAIELEDGIVYPQFILSPAGPMLVEIAIRIPGGFMREVAMHLSGIDLVDVVIHQALGGRDPLASVQRREATTGLCVRFVTALDAPRIGRRPDRGCREAVAAMPGIASVHWHLADDRPVPPLAHSGGRFGAVIGLGGDRAEAERRAEAAVEHLLGVGEYQSTRAKA